MVAYAPAQAHPFAARLTVISSAGLVQDRGHLDVAAAAIHGGADAIQLRAPQLPDRELLPLAAEMATMCREAGVTFIVNDRPAIAVTTGADGVHLGQSDRPDQARAVLPHQMMLGVSVETPDQACRAARLGATYLGVTVWPTPTKPEALPVGLKGLRAICGATALPVVGIGGINALNAAQVVAVGARGVAVISAVGAADDMVAATRALVAALRRYDRASSTHRDHG